MISLRAYLRRRSYRLFYCAFFFGFYSLITVEGLLGSPFSTALAQTQPTQPQVNRETLEQADRERTQLLPNVYEYNTPTHEEEFSFKNFLKNLHGGYYVSLMGPRLVGASNETYNVYLADVAPIQLFHAWSLGYQVNEDIQIGISESAVQNLSDGVVGNTGYVRNQSFELYDPNIYFNLPNLVKIKGWNIFTSLAFSLSLSQASQDAGKVTAITIAQNWNIANPPKDWTIGFTLYGKPQFYTDPLPEGYTDRQTFSLAFGHFLAYAVSPTFALQTSSTFDVEHRSPDSQGLLHLGPNLEDRFRFSCSIIPQTGALLLSLGGYFQFLIWNPNVQTSIVGADFSIGF